jgi:uncharacterized phage protein (TIGR01671 family)
MNRAIKFRAWSKVYNEMLYDHFALTTDGTPYPLNYLCGDYAIANSEEVEGLLKRNHDIDYPVVMDFAVFAHEDLILMQFTGLLDKNGKEIYEGDVVKYTEHPDYTLPSFVAEIAWDADYAAFVYLKPVPWEPYHVHALFSEHDEILHDVLGHMEVIGNIYENGSLLDGTNID